MGCKKCDNQLFTKELSPFLHLILKWKNIALWFTSHLEKVSKTIRVNHPSKFLSLLMEKEFISVLVNLFKQTNGIKAKQIVKGKSEQAQLINDYLIQVRNRIYQKEMELIKSGYIVTPTLLRDAYLGRIESLNERTLFQVFAEHNEEQKKLVGKGVSKATYFISEYTDRLLKEYIKQKYKREDLFLRELNLSFIQSFHTFLKIDKGMTQNSSTKHLIGSYLGLSGINQAQLFASSSLNCFKVNSPSMKAAT